MVHVASSIKKIKSHLNYKPRVSEEVLKIDWFKEYYEKNTKVSIMGVGYVGLPLALAFSKNLKLLDLI